MLPDVTASTGLKPAPELKNESVMSILGPRKWTKLSEEKEK